MKTKTKKKRDRAIRLGLNDPTLTSGVSREEISSFYKRGGRTPSKQEKLMKQNSRIATKLKKLY